MYLDKYAKRVQKRRVIFFEGDAVTPRELFFRAVRDEMAGLWKRLIR
jgi:hypothetical protein